jgi:hypothetical protein
LTRARATVPVEKKPEISKKKIPVPVKPVKVKKPKHIVKALPAKSAAKDR